MSRKTKFRNKDEAMYGLETGILSDSEEELSKEEKRLLEKVRKKRTIDNFDSEDEVYGLQDDQGTDEDEDEDDGDDEDADSMKSDIEGLQEDDDLPDERAWGKKKKQYYSTDYVDQDYATTNQQDLEAAEIEEQEARNIQKRLAEQLDDADFGLDLLYVAENRSEDEKESQQVVKADLSKLTKRQKQALMVKESPEFSGLVEDLKTRLTEAKDVLQPFLELVNRCKFSDSLGLTYVTTKYQVVLNYCTNILYYLMLKADRIIVNSHPVIKRLAQYRQLLNQLESGEGTLLEEITEVLRAAKENPSLYSTKNPELSIGRKRRVSGLINEKVKYPKIDDEISKQEPIEQFEEEQSEMEESADENENQEAEIISNEVDGKRAITRQIAKNKGLTPYRKKELRNPRVKHRNKYRKAKIRRKGAVREVRKEVTRYSGEMSGIKASVRKSIKLK